jgi:NADH:ubiquinone oxidoreductase subunit 5 (subunit L)/multisubunit Na+/H+ antiporter MnhA subunit
VHEAPGVAVELLGILLSILISHLWLCLMAWAYYIRHEAWPPTAGEAFQLPAPADRPQVVRGRVVRRRHRPPAEAVSGWFARVFDPKVIDGAVNAVGDVTVDAGEAVRKLQNGAIPTYALSIFLGVVACVYFISG